ncbi:MAG: FtsB family cell division protein [Bacillota bacterium]
MDYLQNKNLLVVFFVLMIIIILFAGWKFYINFCELEQLNREMKQLENNLKEAKQKNEELETKLKRVDDEEYIEQIAREKLGLVKPGETLLIPVEEEEK